MPWTRSRRFAAQLLSAVLVAPVTSAAAAPNLLDNGDFEQPALPSTGIGYVTYTAGERIGDGWRIGFGSVDLHNSAQDAYWTMASGQQAVDLAGAGERGSLVQDVATEPGARYWLSFQLAINLGCGPAYAPLDVKVDGNVFHETSVSTDDRTPADMGWETRGFEFTADGESTRISFEAVEDAWCGPAIDAVSLTRLDAPPTPAPIPPPPPAEPREPPPSPAPDSPSDDGSDADAPDAPTDDDSDADAGDGDATTDDGGVSAPPLPTDTCVEQILSPHEHTVLQAYIAYYGRPGDLLGLRYWADRLAAEDGDLSAIIEAFGYSQEFIERYGALDDRELIRNLFQQLFGRDPDPAGWDFYADSLAQGTRTLPTIALDVLYGAQNNDAAIIANKVLAASDFVSLLDCTGAAYNATNLDAAARLITRVDESDASRSVARAASLRFVGLRDSDALSYELFVHPDDGRLFSSIDPDGQILTYFGARDATGMVADVDGASFRNLADPDQNLTLLTDAANDRVTLLGDNGIALDMEWSTDASGNPQQLFIYGEVNGKRVLLAEEQVGAASAQAPSAGAVLAVQAGGILTANQQPIAEAGTVRVNVRDACGNPITNPTTGVNVLMQGSPEPGLLSALPSFNVTAFPTRRVEDGGSVWWEASLPFNQAVSTATIEETIATINDVVTPLCDTYNQGSVFAPVLLESACISLAAALTGPGAIASVPSCTKLVVGVTAACQLISPGPPGTKGTPEYVAENLQSVINGLAELTAPRIGLNAKVSLPPDSSVYYATDTARVDRLGLDWKLLVSTVEAYPPLNVTVPCDAVHINADTLPPAVVSDQEYQTYQIEFQRESGEGTAGVPLDLVLDRAGTTATEGVDFQLYPEPQFAAGQLSTFTTLQIFADDDDEEGDETIQLRLMQGEGYRVERQPSIVSVTIQDSACPRDLIMNRYLPIGDDGGIIRDTVTGLEWQRCSVGQTWNQATCDCMGWPGEYTWAEAVSLTAPGGFRLSDISQLRTLVYCSTGDPELIGLVDNHTSCDGPYQRPTIVEEAFPLPGAHGWLFWSSSADAYASSNAWYVDFYYGRVYSRTKTPQRYVRLVR